MADGLFDFLGGFGTTPPSYMEGLLGSQATESLRKRSIGSGLVNALIGYAAAPKNQNLGLGRILASAAQAGMQGARGVYDQAGQDLVMQQKIEDMKRTQAKAVREDEQQIASRNAIDMLLQRPEVANDPMAVAFIRANPAEALKQYTTPRERKTATVGNQVIDLNTNEVIFTGDRERKTSRVDAGNKILVVDDATGETIREIPKGLAPQAPAKPKEASPVSYTIKTDANGNSIYVPNKPGSPAIDMQGNPVAFNPALTPTEVKLKDKQRQASSLPAVIKEAENLIKNATGSYIGAGVDALGQVVGLSTEGAKNIAGLKALEANLILTMPRLEGPQSNLDQMLYRQAAGQIGDPTVPNDTKLAALKTIKGISAKSSSSGATPARTTPANTMDAVQQELERRKTGKK